MNKNKKPLSPSQIKRRQTLTFVIFFGLLITIATVFIFSTEDTEEQDKLILNSQQNKIIISDPSNNANAEDRWLEMSESKMEELEQKNKTQEQKIEELQKNLEDLISKYSNDMILSESRNLQIQTLEQEISTLKNSKDNNGPHNLNNPNSDIEYNGFNDPYGNGYNNYNNSAFSQNIESVEFNNINSNNENSVDNNPNIHNIKNYLPAGSYVPAKVISGVDASVGLSSASDPRPVLFRITGKAISALHKNKKLKTNLKGCIVTGAASGDLSSEKVFVRLLKMTCSKDKDTVIETEVKGYATAIGKAGIRGQVVSREGNLLAKSFFAGVIGGMGNMSSQALEPTLEINSGIATEQVSSRDILKQGLSDGVSKSSDRLSEYLIDRAEQYQPVISIPAGIDVELVFHSGVYLDGRVIEQDKNNKSGNSLVNINTGAQQ
jgi:conjugal transfer pilus assembly protein TraB